MIAHTVQSAMGRLWTEVGARQVVPIVDVQALVRTVGGVTTSSAPEPLQVPIRVLLPGDQEVVARLWSRRQTPDGWRCEVGLPAYCNGPEDSVEPELDPVLKGFDPQLRGR
ncbi:hypothetical protein [Streptomyces sp. NPDC093795]|uniref:hypothetical protein n=1 Tax=Streptomyces sp. NPDC093795 TaxID=3366051 RepID=UPI00382D8968